jgi:hypothetical protein
MAPGLDPEMFEDTAKIVNEAMKEKARCISSSITAPESIGSPESRGVIDQGDLDHSLPVASVYFLCLDRNPMGIQTPNGDFLHFIHPG